MLSVECWMISEEIIWFNKDKMIVF